MHVFFLYVSYVGTNMFLHSLMSYQLWLRYFNLFPSVMWGQGRREKYLKGEWWKLQSDIWGSLQALFFTTNLSLKREAAGEPLLK